ncbi:Protein CBG22142 [Caenorhabditis briggsae]|uniref:Protein CBG22142 n=1 Tax=Caenorhabditis briggsae TaxID=6238 RepID=A8Y1M5_CAEBR|nr:Protein CBG22142 [Caenorhabditis briggsae]CAP38795.2 Protein CBG22142 [Caenorhabditis briggsae]
MRTGHSMYLLSKAQLLASLVGKTIFTSFEKYQEVLGQDTWRRYPSSKNLDTMERFVPQFQSKSERTDPPSTSITAGFKPRLERKTPSADARFVIFEQVCLICGAKITSSVNLYERSNHCLTHIHSSCTTRAAGRRYNLSLDGIAISNDLQSILRATEFKRNAAMYQTELTEITRALDAARQRLMVAEQRTNQLSAESRELKAERDHLVNQINARDEYEFDQPIGRPEH